MLKFVSGHGLFLPITDEYEDVVYVGPRLAVEAATRLLEQGGRVDYLEADTIVLKEGQPHDYTLYSVVDSTGRLLPATRSERRQHAFAGTPAEMRVVLQAVVDWHQTHERPLGGMCVNHQLVAELRG